MLYACVKKFNTNRLISCCGYEYICIYVHVYKYAHYKYVPHYNGDIQNEIPRPRLWPTLFFRTSNCAYITSFVFSQGFWLASIDAFTYVPPLSNCEGRIFQDLSGRNESTYTYTYLRTWHWYYFQTDNEAVWDLLIYLRSYDLNMIL